METPAHDPSVALNLAHAEAWATHAALLAYVERAVETGAWDEIEERRARRTERERRRESAERETREWEGDEQGEQGERIEQIERVEAPLEAVRALSTLERDQGFTRRELHALREALAAYLVDPPVRDRAAAERALSTVENVLER